jgi:hypothetical protein
VFVGARRCSSGDALYFTDSLHDVSKLDVDHEHSLIIGQSFFRLIECLRGTSKKIQYSDQFLVAVTILTERSREYRRRDAVLLLLDETLAKRFVRRLSVRRSL